MIGLEVEEVDESGRPLKPFTIAKVLEGEAASERRPAARLEVDTGDGEPVADRLRRAQRACRPCRRLARPGDYVPGIDVTLSVGKIRGVESFGMMCSERELSCPTSMTASSICRGRAGRVCPSPNMPASTIR
jgi:phenylalanyl-tRNA synthetase beta chain